MTHFVSTRYPQLWMVSLGVRFTDGHAEVNDPDVAARLAASTTPGIALAPGERLPDDGGPDPDSEQGDGQGPDNAQDDDQDPGSAEPKRPAANAKVADWREYILATYDVEPSEVADMTKAQLQDLADEE